MGGCVDLLKMDIESVYRQLLELNMAEPT